ncbi:MAG: nuclear transport factor 2 family protein [Pseudomonadota bacterium]
MTRWIALAALVLATPLAPPLAAEGRLAPGIWTNNEDVYFAEEEGRKPAEWTAFEVAMDGRWRRIDAFGKPLTDFTGGPIAGLTQREGGSGWQIGASELRQARAFACWVSVRKSEPKPDGSPAWGFANKLSMFDQGGRVLVSGEGAAPDVTIRMRNVTWAKGSRNKPSLVLYVHKDDPERAESYSWASPDARLVGVNLRWVQGSCSRADTPPPTGDAAHASLVAAGQRWKELYEAGDWNALRALYADDAVLMTQGSPKAKGAEAILAFLKRLETAGGEAEISFAPEEAVADGGFGFVIAKYQMDVTMPGSPPSAVAGRSMLIYKWVDGAWLLWRDMDNFAPDVMPR